MKKLVSAIKLKVCTNIVSIIFAFLVSLLTIDIYGSGTYAMLFSVLIFFAALLATNLVMKIFSSINREKAIAARPQNKDPLSVMSKICVGILSIFILYAILNPKPSIFIFNAILSVVIAGAIINILCWLGTKIPSTLSKRKEILVVGCILLATFVLQLIFTHALHSTLPTWDAAHIHKSAQLIAEGHSVANSSYFFLFPNNIGSLLLLSSVFKLGSMIGANDYITIGMLLNAALLISAGALMYLVIRKLSGHKVAMPMLLLALPLFIIHPYLQTPYSDTFSIVIPILITYLLLEMQAKSHFKKVLLSVGIGVSLGIGILIKPTVAIIAIAMIIVCVAMLLSKKRTALKYIALYSSVIFIGAFLSYITPLAISQKYDLLPFNTLFNKSTEYGTPFTTFVMMGQHNVESSNNYGGFNTVDYSTNILRDSRAQQASYSFSETIHRIIDRGIVGNIIFSSNKSSWILGDGTFFAFGEGGSDKVTYTNHDMISTGIRTIITIPGQAYPLYAMLLNGAWVAVLVLILIQSLRYFSPKFSYYYLLLALTLVGLILFHIISEARSRYVFLYVPLFVVLSSYTVNSLTKRVSK